MRFDLKLYDYLSWNLIIMYEYKKWIEIDFFLILIDSFTFYNEKFFWGSNILIDLHIIFQYK